MGKKMLVNEVGHPDDKYMAECDMRTLMAAKEIRADKKRLEAALKSGREQLKNLKNTIGDEK